MEPPGSEAVYLETAFVEDRNTFAGLCHALLAGFLETSDMQSRKLVLMEAWSAQQNSPDFLEDAPWGIGKVPMCPSEQNVQSSALWPLAVPYSMQALSPSWLDTNGILLVI